MLAFRSGKEARRLRGWAIVGLVALLCAGSGCSVFHPIRPPSLEEAAPPCLPRCCKDHVYIFLVHGMDPLNYCNLSGVRNYCNELGYNNTYYGQVYHGGHFLDEIHKIRSSDPDAHFVLIGFSAGANVVRGMANDLGEQNIPVDLVVYLGGNTLKDTPRSRPANVGKVVHILATGYVWKGYPIDGAENIKYAKAWHFDSPTHPETLRMLAHELAAISCRVPVLEPVVPEPPEEIPLPRPVPMEKVTQSEKRPHDEEWDFLKPQTALRTPETRWPNRRPAEVAPARPLAPQIAE